MSWAEWEFDLNWLYAMNCIKITLSFNKIPFQWMTLIQEWGSLRMWIELMILSDPQLFPQVCFFYFKWPLWIIQQSRVFFPLQCKPICSLLFYNEKHSSAWGAKLFLLNGRPSEWLLYDCYLKHISCSFYYTRRQNCYLIFPTFQLWTVQFVRL